MSANNNTENSPHSTQNTSSTLGVDTPDDKLSTTNLQVVVGLGASGLSAVNFLLQQGYPVAVTDGNAEPALAKKLPAAVTHQAFSGICADLLAQAARIVISPGIALTHPAIMQAQALNIPIVSDIQLFHEALKVADNHVPIVAITGSNAKSTVTTLVGEMAKDAGINVGVGGNIGVPALTLLDSISDKKMELAVLELSSFQLETVTDLGAEVATILNLSPDHLDRHGDMDNYCQLKQRIFQNSKKIVVNRDDPATMMNAQAVADMSAVAFSSFGTDSEEAQFALLTTDDGQVYLALEQEQLINTSELKIKGQHNQLNALAALALGEAVGISMESMLTTLKEFAGLPHRCQHIANIDGIDYFNDSKGTNMGSTIAAIKGLGESYRSSEADASIMLIIGGQGKGQDFSELSPFINQFVSHLYFIGEDAVDIEKQLAVHLSDSVLRQQVHTLETALSTIEKDKLHAQQVKAVLLSPACASFDQYTGYVQRGDEFISLVNNISTNHIM